MRRIWYLGLQLVAIWTVPAVIAATQTWLAMTGSGRSVATLPLLLGELASWYLWAAVTPLVLYLARRHPPTTADYRWIAPHTACATAFTVLRATCELLYSLPVQGTPLTVSNVARGLRDNLPFEFLLNVIIYAVVLTFGTVALRERAESEAFVDSGPDDRE